MTASGDDTALAGINRLVASAKLIITSTTPNRAAALWSGSLAAAVITAIIWLVVGGPENIRLRVVPS